MKYICRLFIIFLFLCIPLQGESKTKEQLIPKEFWGTWAMDSCEPSRERVINRREAYLKEAKKNGEYISPAYVHDFTNFTDDNFLGIDGGGLGFYEVSCDVKKVIKQKENLVWKIEALCVGETEESDYEKYYIKLLDSKNFILDEEKYARCNFDQ